MRNTNTWQTLPKVILLVLAAVLLGSFGLVYELRQREPSSDLAAAAAVKVQPPEARYDLAARSSSDTAAETRKPPAVLLGDVIAAKLIGVSGERWVAAIPDDQKRLLPFNDLMTIARRSAALVLPQANAECLPHCGEFLLTDAMKRSKARGAQIGAVVFVGPLDLGQAEGISQFILYLPHDSTAARAEDLSRRDFSVYFEKSPDAAWTVVSVTERTPRVYLTRR